ncbi:MAG: hypothetical protein ACI3XS_03270 [Eubacteriales bacterium]
MRLILDRISQDDKGKKIAVFEVGDDFVTISEDNMPAGFADTLTDGIIIEADYRDGVIYSATLLTEETEKKKKEMKSRLNALFNRGKK